MNKQKQLELSGEMDELIDLLKNKNKSILRIVIDEKEFLLSSLNESIISSSKNLNSIEENIDNNINYLGEINLKIKTQEDLISKNVSKIKDLKLEIAKLEELISSSKENEEDLKTREWVYLKNMQHLEREKTWLIMIRDEVDRSLVKIEISNKPIYMYARSLQRTMDDHKYSIDILNEISRIATTWLN